MIDDSVTAQTTKSVLSAQATTQVPDGRMSARRKRILIADDHPAVVGVLRFNLEQAGYETCVACDGLEAWEILAQQPFDLVIFDQQMPHLTGSELCQRMRQCRHHQHTPIFMLTGKGLELDVPTLEDELGVALILSKPFSPVALVEAVREQFAKLALNT